MASKPKVRSPAKRSQKAAKEKPQRERFIEAARDLGVDESGAEFDRLFRKVVPGRAVARTFRVSNVETYRLRPDRLFEESVARKIGPAQVRKPAPVQIRLPRKAAGDSGNSGLRARARKPRSRSGQEE